MGVSMVSDVIFVTAKNKQKFAKLIYSNNDNNKLDK